MAQREITYETMLESINRPIAMVWLVIAVVIALMY
jgi:hypothetical protein